jgi:hypothetical protein
VYRKQRLEILAAPISMWGVLVSGMAAVIIMAGGIIIDVDHTTGETTTMAITIDTGMGIITIIGNSHITISHIHTGIDRTTITEDPITHHVLISVIVVGNAGNSIVWNKATRNRSHVKKIH